MRRNVFQRFASLAIFSDVTVVESVMETQDTPTDSFVEAQNSDPSAFLRQRLHRILRPA
jgi:hypothetical protein